MILTTSAQALLARIAPLTGAWGTEQYGLADARVVKALEGLEGAETCARYSFVEQRGTWAAETKRLEKELTAHSKHKQRVGVLHVIPRRMGFIF